MNNTNLCVKEVDDSAEGLEIGTRQTDLVRRHDDVKRADLSGLQKFVFSSFFDGVERLVHGPPGERPDC